jgi:hypothetical protein
VEVRSIWTSTELCGYLDFPYAAQVFIIRREVTEMVAQKSRCETVHGLSSLPVERATPACLLALSRGHWTIENRLHWVRDVTFDEDRSRLRTVAGAQVMASIRNLAISASPVPATSPRRSATAHAPIPKHSASSACDFDGTLEPSRRTIDLFKHNP